MTPQTKKAVIYARVSTERQADPDRVSIEHQLETCQKLCETVGAEVIGIFVDKERYRKTKSPNKGSVVEPSGKFDDRPYFLEMLERIESGDIDMIVAFDVTRLGRHFRVLGTLANSLDIARQGRNGNGEVQVWEAAKHAILSGVMLGLMISIAQEENESRIRRVIMGIEGTLKQGRWPTKYQLWGYDSIKEPGKRGHLITLGKPEDVRMIQDIFNWAEMGEGTNKIGHRLKAHGIGLDERNISRLLRNPAYKGELTYTLVNGSIFTLQIPAIITPEQWERVQAQRIDNTLFAIRNTKTIFLAQHIAFCGICGRAMTAHSARYRYIKTDSGGTIREARKNTITYYICNRGSFEPHEHSRYPGGKADVLIWRKLADVIHDNPEEIIKQTIAKAESLQAEGDDVNGRIGQYQKRLTELDNEELAYNRQQARGKLTEEKYDILIAEVNAARKQVTTELGELITLRDETEKVQSTLDHARKMLADFGQRIEEINMSEDELKSLPDSTRQEVLRRRQQLVRALVDRVEFYPDRIELTGAIGNKTVSLIDCQLVERQTINLQYRLLINLSEMLAAA